MNPRFLGSFLVIVFLGQTLLQSVGATHLVPSDPEFPAQPKAPEKPITTTGNELVNRHLQDVADAGRDANKKVEPYYDHVNRTYQEQSKKLPEGVLELYDDRIDAGHRVGGFGDWAVIGSAAWDDRSQAGFNKTAGYTTGVKQGFKYPGNAQSLLLLPELDLKTGFVDPVPAQAMRQLPEQLQRDLSFSGVYRQAMEGADWAVRRYCFVGDNPAAPSFIGCFPERGENYADPADAIFQLEFQRRFNLAQGDDGVQIMVFGERPAALPAPDSCARTSWLVEDQPSPTPRIAPAAPTCTIVHPLDKYPGYAAVFEDTPAYTGYQNWSKSTIDLSPWAGDESVWVGFYFASRSIVNDVYFNHTTKFAQNQGFYGFSVDDMRLTGPAPPVNVRVRSPLVSPQPTMPLDQPIPAIGHVINTGTTPVEAEIVVRLLENGLAQDEVVSAPFTLQPGRSRTFEAEFPAVNEPKAFTIEFLARYTDDDLEMQDADPSDNRVLIDIEVKTIDFLRFGELRRGIPTARLGDSVPFFLEVENLGNIPKVVTLLADVIDLQADPPAPDNEALYHIEGQTSQTFTLARGETRTITWDVKGREEGQYRLFVRTPDASPFNPDDLVPEISRTYQSAYGTPTVDGVVGEQEWDGAYEETIELRNPYSPFTAEFSNPARTGTLRVMNDQQKVYFSIEVQDDQAQNGDAAELDRDELTLLIDDLGNEVALAGEEDGLRINRGGGQDLHYDGPTQSWIPDAAQDGVATGRGGVGGPERWVYEFSRPLDAADANDLQSKPGDAIGLFAFAEVWDKSKNAPFTAKFVGDYHYPPGAHMRDGQSFWPADGALGDELAAWRKIRLATAPAVPTSATFRNLSLGFGIERSPPPFFEENLSTCDGLAGWTQTAIVNPPGTPLHTKDVEKWNCAAMGADPKLRLFEGMSPDATCNGVPCKPWSGIGEPGSSRPRSHLVTPPIRIENVANPYVVLRHQYSTDVLIQDRLQAPPGWLGPGRFTLNSIAQLYLEVWDEGNQTWSYPLLLIPDSGYSSEESVGIADPAIYGPSGRQRVQGPVNECDGLEVCGWWWPTGMQSEYRPQNESFPTGAAFSGSPWLVDRIPLFGGAHNFSQAEPVHVAGKTIRLRFAFFTSAGPNDPHAVAPKDYGWRLEGLAVTEGPQFLRDVSVEDVSIQSELFDPARIGLGPGTNATVRVEVRNNGVLDARAVKVRIEGIDVSPTGAASPLLCEADAEIDDVIPPGQTREIVVECPLADLPGAVLKVRAQAEAPEGDDFLGNNGRSADGAYELRATHDAAAVVGAAPRVASADFERALFVEVENRGNVPLSEFLVHRMVVRRDGVDGGTAIIDGTWKVEGTLPVGARLSIDSPLLQTDPPLTTDDVSFNPGGRSGAFDVIASVELAQDADRSNDVDVVSLVALDTLYSNDLDKPVRQDSGVVTGDLRPGGTSKVWDLQSNGYEGSQRMLAGDPLTDEIRANADAWLDLPDLDLTTVRRATLAFKQRYDLEPEFDGARVEVSTDGAKTWRPLKPEGTSATEGTYPGTLLGLNPIAANGTQPEAYTGRSEDLDSSGDDGWTAAEFDLANDPGLRRRATIDSFRLTGLPALPTKEPFRSPTGEAQFLNPDWVLDEPNAEARQRYWWIQNLTRDVPAPHSGKAMWWSGTAGNQSESHDLEVVHTRLEFPFQAAGTGRAKEQVLLTWWSYKSGQADGGTGGRFTQGIVGKNPTLLEFPDESDGWRRYGFDITPFLGQALTLWFEYESVADGPDYLDPLLEKNLGWFVDDVEVTSYIFDPTLGLRLAPQPLWIQNLDTLEQDATSGNAGDWVATVLPGASNVRWSLAAVGAASQDGGWQVGSVDIPGQGDVQAWKFAADNAQGYPHLADSRLVTPVVDMRSAAGETARLNFDQWYRFEAREKCHNGQPDSCFLSAVDGGTVEFQTFDERTGKFGPWTQLGPDFNSFPERLLLDAERVTCTGQQTCTVLDVDGLTDDSPFIRPGQTSNRLQASNTGYTAIEERGENARPSFNCAAILQDTLWNPVGHGTSFARYPAMAKFWLDGKFCAAANVLSYEQPWRPYPVSHVFSGQSPGVDGWQPVSWDITPLLGQTVRFAFHASTNPGFSGGPPGGWSIANVGIEGDVFDGKPAKIRLRLGTDESVTKGEWSIDDLEIVGERFQKNVAIIVDGDRTLVGEPGGTVEFRGNISNLGREARLRLALAFVATREDGTTKTPYNLIDVIQPADSLAPLPTVLSGVTKAYGPFDLDAGGPGNDVIPIRVRIQLPSDAGSEITLRVLVLEDHGTPQIVNGVIVPNPRYEAADNEVPGNVADLWRAVGKHVQALALVPPVLDRSGVLIAEPASGPKLQPITLRAAIENTGSTQPETTVRWTVLELTRKGDPTAQPGTLERATQRLQETRDLGIIARGTTKAFSMPFVPQDDGLYRALLDVIVDDAVVKSAQLEFLVGQSGQYSSIDFAQTPFSDAGWKDVSPRANASAAGSPADVRFRQVGEEVRWGVGPEQFNAGQTYCTVAKCNYNAGPGIQHIFGLEGVAQGPSIDLGRVPQGRAVLTLTHGFNLEPGDGARVEAVPIVFPVDARRGEEPAFRCANGDPMAFRLVPVADDALAHVSTVPGFLSFANGEEFVPTRIQPLAKEAARPDQAFGGPVVGRRIDQFRLDLPAESTCRGSDGLLQTRVLANYTVWPRLHVGTLPGVLAPSVLPSPRWGAEAWHVQSLRASSTGVDVSAQRDRLPALDGAPKRFLIDVENTGQVVDTLRLSVDMSTSTILSESWLQFPQSLLTLAPGQRKSVPVLVAIPANPSLSRGDYLARIVATSTTDPNVVDAFPLTLGLRSNPLPDLAIILATEQGASPQFEQDRVEPVHATIHNVGQTESKAVRISLEAKDVATGRTTAIDSIQLPALCPKKASACTGPSSQSVSFEWAVPANPGHYLLTAKADSEDRLLEERKSNNLASLAVVVVPLRRPDVAVTDLVITGLDPDGLAEDGSLLTFTANVTNLGHAAANKTHVRILFNSTELREISLESLEAGESRLVSAIKVVSRGEYTVRASALLLDGTETRIDNNEFRRVLRVRGHDLSLAATPAKMALAPGETGHGLLTLTNRGNTVERVLVALNTSQPGWGFLATPNPVAVPANGDVSIAIAVLASSHAPAGPANLRITAAPASNPQAAGQTTLIVDVLKRLDAPLVVPTNGTFAPGPNLLPMKIVSRSNVDENITVTLSQTDWQFTPLRIALPAGATRDVKLALTLPIETAAGSYHAALRLLDSKDQPIGSEPFSVEVLPSPQAKAAWNGNPVVRPSELGVRQVRINVNVTNIGNVPIVARLEPRGLLEGLTADPVTGEALPSGRSGNVPLTVRLAPDAPDRLFGFVDVWIRPTNASNDVPSILVNTLELPDLSDAPDLTIARVDAIPRGGLKAGQRLAVAVLIENRGLVASPPTLLYASVNGFLAEHATVPELAPGAATTVNLTWAFTDAGHYLVTFAIDGGGDVEESQEDNNGVSVPFQVGASGARAVPGTGPLITLAMTLLAGMTTGAARLRRRRQRDNP